MRSVSLLIGAYVVAATAASAKDLIIREQITGGRGNAAAREVTQYIAGKKRVSDAPNMRSIIDLEAKTITMIDKNRKTYTEMTFEQLRAQSDALDQRIRSLPANIRDMVGHVTNIDAALTLKPTKHTEKIAGYTAKEYTIEAESMSGSVWITDAIDVASDGREWEDFGGALANSQGRRNKLGAAVAKLKGLPLRTTVKTTVGRDEITTKTETLEIKEGPPPPEMLKVPAGYAQITAPTAAQAPASKPAAPASKPGTP